MKFIFVLFLVFTNLLFVQSCAARTVTDSDADYRIVGGKTSTVVPFELFDNRQMLKVKINGEGPFTFVLDTGGRNLVTPEVTERLGLKLTDEFQTGGIGEIRVSAWWTQVKKVEIGEIIAKNQRFVVLSLEDIKKTIGFKEFDGLVGQEVFQSFTTRIDFEKNEMTFTNPESFEYRGKGEIIPLEFAGHIPQIVGEIDGIEGKIVVDTGDRSSLTLFVPFYEKNDFQTKYPERRKALTGWGIGGGIPSEMFRLKSIKIGKTEISEIITRLPLVKSGAFAGSDNIASIGSGLLKRFNVIFDYKQKRIILEKNKHFHYEDKFENYVLKEKKEL
jgi:hypothetical protein